MTPHKLKITNGQILTPYGVIPGGTVIIAGETITGICELDVEVEDAVEINAGGKYISPGFIDIHVHGGGGHDFMDGNVEAFLKIAETHSKYGTTSMLPTTLTSTKEDLLNILGIYDQANEINTHARFLGMHVEGPYFAMNQRGAQDPRYIRDPDPEEYREILSTSNAITRWSVAPELSGAIEMGKYLRERNILPSIAHTDAIYQEVLSAYENGYTLVTHLYSGMSGVSRRNAYRHAGVIESSFIIDELDVELIADGKHLPGELLKLVYKIKGPDRIALITDAMRGAAMPEGASILGNVHSGIEVVIEDGVAKSLDRSMFAGSVATASQLVRNMISLAGVPLTDAVKMMTSTPARIMGVSHKKGLLVEGGDADIIIFDDQINVEKTILAGRVIFSAQDATPVSSALHS